ncbi:MAG TPA: hypothetical protein VLA72_09700 [Anaerolineales bacterium]|nr:hypothetical protein [Anaerolineales bacterium]
MQQRIKLLAIGFTLALLTACVPTNQPTAINTVQAQPTVIPLTEISAIPILLEHASIYTTQNSLSGNHLVNGSIDLANATALDIPVDGKPVWLVSAPFKGNAIFVAVMEDGNVKAFKISGTSFESFDISPTQLPAGMPPALLVTDDQMELLTPPEDASALTNPILINGKLVYIASNGDLVMNDLESQTRLPINALLDSRILIDGKNRLVVLTQPTNRYDHGIAGDDLESSAIMLVETELELRVVQTITINEPDVIEGISAIWADIDNDGTQDIIVTLSNDQTGARIVVYREDGTLLAESEPIGLGYRWRHQLALAQFETDKPPLLVSVRTPHIGGIVEFIEFHNGKLDNVREINGFSTHSIGSRNLDSGLAGDFNNHGITELLAPDQRHTSLGVISLDGVIATLSLDGVLTSNLTATELDGKLYVGAGTEGNLRIWIP